MRETAAVVEEPASRVAGILQRPEYLARTFNQAASAYDGRPGYPAIVYEVLARECGVTHGTRVLEIGPGLGQATLPLLRMGAVVTAVEPGPEMAALLRERMPDSNLNIIVSRFEDASVADDSFDLVTAATSFHWVDPAVGIAKAARLLHDGGWLALWWTIWGGDSDRPDPFHGALLPVMARKAPELIRDEHGSNAYRRDLDARVSLAESDGSFGPVHKHVIDWEGTHDPAGLRRLFATFAGWIALADNTRNDLLDEVERIARDQFGGSVTRPYQTIIYLARRHPRTA